MFVTKTRLEHRLLSFPTIYLFMDTVGNLRNHIKSLEIVISKQDEQIGTLLADVKDLQNNVNESNKLLTLFVDVFAQKGYLLEVSNESHDFEVTDDNCNTKKYKVNRKK